MKRYQARLVLVLALGGLGGCAELLIPRDSETGKLLQQARQGSAESQYELGLRYTQGVVLKQNYQKGVEQFQKAAAQGHQKSAYLLGMAYLTGRGTTQDFVQARQWLERAALAGHVAAQYQIGTLYLNGQGGATEPEWGAYWLGRAADRGHTQAQYDLGAVYQAGAGVSADHAVAWKWLKIAESGGVAEATPLLKTLTPQLNALELNRARYWVNNWAPVEGNGSPDNHLVRFAQQRLNALGYEPGKVDGVMGSTTQLALKRFAEEQGLQEATLSPALVEALRKSAPSKQDG